MNIPAKICLFIFISLFVSSVFLQWMRAKKRQQIVRNTDPAQLSAVNQQKWNFVEGSIDFMFRDFRKLQILKKSADRLSAESRTKLAHYRWFSRLEITVTASMFIFGAIAFLFCG
jgi:hypothetical protein